MTEPTEPISHVGGKPPAAAPATPPEPPAAKGGRPVYHKSGRGKAWKPRGGKGGGGGDRELAASAKDAHDRAVGAEVAAKEFKKDAEEAEKELEKVTKALTAAEAKVEKLERKASEEAQSAAERAIKALDFEISESTPWSWKLTASVIMIAVVWALARYYDLDPEVRKYLICAVAMFGYYVQRTVRYSYAGLREDKDLDLRPDSQSLLPDKHQCRAGYVRVTETMRWRGINLTWWLAPFVSKQERRRLVVSFEMIAQLATDQNLALTSTEEVAWERICSSARSLQTVRYDRYLALTGVNIKQDTCLLVLALYRKMWQDVKESFPRPVAL